MERRWGRTKPPVGIPIDNDHTLSKGLVAAWLFNESTPLFSVSPVPPFRKMVATGAPKFALGPFGGQSVLFDGSTQFYSIATPLVTAEPYTYAAWFNTTNNNALQGIFSIYSAGTTNATLMVRNDQSGKLQMRRDSANHAESAVAITANAWQLGVGSALSNATALNVYLNGLNLGSAGTASLASATTTAIGQGPGASVNFFSGMIDNVFLWKRVLSAQEVLDFYIRPFDLFLPPVRRIYFAPVAGIQFDAASNSTYQTGQSSYSWNHTCTGTNRFLAVDVSLLSVPGTTVSSITYNGTALSFIGAKSTVSGAGRVECWGLAAPDTGTNSITVTLSAAVGSAGTAVSYTGVHQTSPTEAFNSAQATNVGAADATVTITTVTDSDWVHGAIATDDPAITANQTSRNNVTGAAGSGADEDTGPISPAVGTTISYTNVGALATWAIAGYGIRPSTSASLYQQPPIGAYLNANCAFIGAGGMVP